MVELTAMLIAAGQVHNGAIEVDNLPEGAKVLTEAQRSELDRRLDDMDADNTLGIPWDQVLKQIREHA
jgi:putative addiction module component (TIGR02574 family)